MINFKILGVIGLVLLFTSQILLAQGFEFLQAQQPIDFAHWSLLIGSVLMISFTFIFPKSIFNTLATSLTIVGIVAHIGMCVIDFTLWSFGDKLAERDILVGQLINTPSIWLPFIVVGPSFLYAGLATQAWQFIQSHTLLAILTLAGSFMIGAGYMILHHSLLIVVGYAVFALGLILLIYRKE